MAHSSPNFINRNKMLRTMIRLQMPPRVSLPLLEPMRDMPEEEKEAFAWDLRQRLEIDEILRAFNPYDES